MSQAAYGTDDGFRRAMAEANRMRLRSVGVATCATALAVALTGSLVPARQSSGESRLDMVTTPETPRPTPMPTVTATPYAMPAGTAAGPAAPGAMTGSAPVTRADGSGGRATGASAPRRTPWRAQSTAMTRGITGIVPDVACTFQSDVWCFRAVGEMKEGPAHVRWMQADLCAQPGRSADLRFPTTREVEMRVLDTKGRVLWSWLTDHPAKPRPHTVYYSAGTPCMRWTVKWFERTNGGVRVGPGTYRFEARYLGTAPAGIPVSSVDFRL